MLEANRRPAEILETGVRNLDHILGGGLLRRSIVILMGAPGTGKTLLAQQIAFHTAAQGEVALFLTGYSETHDKLLSHSRKLSFFAPELVGGQFQFGSLLELLREGAEATEEAIVATARAQRASLVVFDGFRSMHTMLGDDHVAAQFLYSLGAKLALLGATTVVIIEGDAGNSANYPELTVSDVILTLRHELGSSHGRRILEVMKSRGSLALPGEHPFRITHDGLQISPRFESTVMPSDPPLGTEPLSVGAADIDALLGGGLTSGTCMLTAGNPGVGKTLLGLQFLNSGLGRDEPGLFLGFMESEAQLRAKARRFGMDLTAGERSGRLRLLVLPAYDLEADAIAEKIQEDIERRGVRRLVIDSAAELERGVHSLARVPDFLAALVSYLRDRNVTTYLTIDLPTIVSPSLEFTGAPLSVLAENLLLLRQVEYRNQLHRVFSVLKMRFSAYDPGIHEYTIVAGEGLRIQGLAPLGEGLLTGVARFFGDVSVTQKGGESQED